MLEGKKGITDIVYYQDNIKKFMAYVPIKNTELYIATFVPKIILNQEFSIIILLTIGLISSIIIVFLFFIKYIIQYKKEKEKIIMDLAYKDEVTGGFNKNKFLLSVKEIIKKENKYAMIFFNIKNFKNVNKIFGINLGNVLLKNILKIMEKYKMENEVVARAKDDNFYLFFCDINIENRIKSILEEIKTIARLNFLNYEIKFEVGIYFVEEKDKNTEINLIIDKAKSALLLKKEINYFDNKIKEELELKEEIESTMQRALENKEFVLYIQPKYNTQTEELVGGEVLIRWKKINGELIFPDKFIPIFEKNGFIKKLDLYLLEQICIKQQEWKNKNYKLNKLSINQSKINLYDKNYIDNIKKIIYEYNAIPELLEFEMTENVFVEDMEKIIELEKKLHEMKISIAIDDFGVGYSTYEFLEKVQIDVLKLDKSFFKELFNNSKAEIVIKSIINMAKELNIITVAEGVEEKEQVNFLKQIKCDQIQGYYFSKPVPIEDFENLIKKKK